MIEIRIAGIDREAAQHVADVATGRGEHGDVTERSMTDGMARQMLDRIRAHYLAQPQVPQPARMTEEDTLAGAVMLTEVPAPTSGRRADAIVIGLTRARGGIEGIKTNVSRSDCLREFKQPIKADGWFPHTHRWWIAVPSSTLVSPGAAAFGVSSCHLSGSAGG